MNTEEIKTIKQAAIRRYKQRGIRPEIASRLWDNYVEQQEKQGQAPDWHNVGAMGILGSTAGGLIGGATAPKGKALRNAIVGALMGGTLGTAGRTGYELYAPQGDGMIGAGMLGLGSLGLVETIRKIIRDKISKKEETLDDKE